MAQLENNSADIKRKHGGARKGSGRKLGSATVRTREIANKAAEQGVTPLEYLLEVMRDPAQEPRDRLRAASDAAPYIHPKLQAITLTGAEDGPIQHSLTIGFK
jgi:hypothetical protein